MVNKIIQLKNISKSFPGVKALDDVSFDLNVGEVHALVGENGAGKSTLMKILSGIYTKDSGTILMNNQEASINNVRDAQNLGIIMIHQDLNLMNHLTVAENIFIGREFKKRMSLFLDYKTQNEKSREIFARLNLDIDPSVKVERLTVAKQQLVEIAKALSYDSKILIMDEPTSSLTDSEIGDLFRVVRTLNNEGRSIIYISHRLEELKQITDRITVMRDGLYIDTVHTQEADIDHVIKMMVGREIFAEKQDEFNNKEAPIALRVENLNAGRMVQDVSFHVRQGEILGFAGLVGAGRTEVAKAIFAAENYESGDIYIHGSKVKIKTPSDAVKAGLAYLSEDRRQFGLSLGLNIDENISLADMEEFSSLGFIKFKKSEQNSQMQREVLDIRTPSLKQKAKFLSGGNQQKVVLAKWLTRNSDIIIFDEPTRGIDVGAKNEIYKLLNELADQGKAIIVISSELPEIIRVFNRVLVMCEGRITGEAIGEDISQNQIMQYAVNRNTKIGRHTS
ncbi:MAG: sugar ABC transporter ATP-binding protein [Clostridiales bacterium]|nr:sugar ABC transporter ATP-binding protein [Clostridiales bacterium]